MVLVHTEEELLATEEPAMCVVGATSCETLDDLSNEKYKTYIRIVRENDAFRNKEAHLFAEMIADPATRGENTDAYENFQKERSRLIFGSDVCNILGRINGITVLCFEKYI